MKRLTACCILILLVPAALFSVELEVYFSPEGGCKEAVLKNIKSAQETIRVMVYVLTDSEIAETLIGANKRGVRIQVIIGDTEPFKEPFSIPRLIKHGIPVYTKTEPEASLMHHKAAIIDNETVITGSFNWSYAAEKFNNEDLLVIRNRKLAEKYTSQFVKILQQARPLKIGEYVSSKKSGVFHYPWCRSVGTIERSNLIYFDFREEAIKAGKRPCKICNP